MRPVSMLGLVSALCLLAQDVSLDSPDAVKFDLKADSPVALLSASMGESRATPRGAALVLEAAPRQSDLLSLA